MRILHVISSIDPRRGGPTTVLAGMIEHQIKAGLEVSLTATSDDGFDPRIADQLRQAGANVELFPVASERFRGRRDISDALRRLIGQHDVVHIHALWEEIQHRAARIAQELHKPYIMTPHGMLDPWCLRQSWLKKRLYLAMRLRRNLQHATAIYCTTETEKRLIEPLRLRPLVIIETLGLDLGEFETLPQDGTFRTHNPHLGDKRIVLFLSRIHPKKGLDLLIPAFAKVAKQHADAVLVIAGPAEDGYDRVIKQLAKDQSINDRVIFTGMLHGKERIEALVDADVFVLPSYQENFGIAVIESMAAGTPVIISDQVNMHPDVTRANAGAVFPAQVEPLAKEMDRWLSEDALRISAAENARRFALEQYDWRKIGERWGQHYEHVIQMGASKP